MMKPHPNHPKEILEEELLLSPFDNTKAFTTALAALLRATLITRRMVCWRKHSVAREDNIVALSDYRQGEGCAINEVMLRTWDSLKIPLTCRNGSMGSGQKGSLKFILIAFNFNVFFLIFT